MSPALPSAAMVLANAGTALMWLTAAHLLLGNLLIGIVEGVLVAGLLRVRVGAAIGLMILANYASSWLGVICRAMTSSTAAGLALEDVLAWHVTALAVLFLLTVLVEWGFVALSVRGKGRSRISVFLVGVLVQAITYAALLALYVPASRMGWVTDTTLTGRADFAVTRAAQVYCLRAGGGGDEVWRVPLRPGAEPARADPESDRHAAALLIRSQGTPNYVDFADLRPEPRGPWSARVGFWAGEGLTIWNEDTGERHRLSLATPLLQRTTTYATLLPGDQIVVAIGGGIYLLDLPTRRLAKITGGREPRVVLP